MPSKRRNNGRNKKNKGHADSIHCSNCQRLAPKDKAVKRFVIKNLVDASSKRDIEEASAYQDSEKAYSMPKFFIKNQYCISCAIHARVVRVRSGEDRRIRYVSKVRGDRKEEFNKLYKLANVKEGEKTRTVKEVEEEEKN
jgi:small subunit ribosomal protein S26e